MVSPRRAQEDHTHSGQGGSVSLADSTLTYAVPRLTGAGSLDGTLGTTSTGTALTLPTPTSGGSTFATRARGGRYITGTTAGFVSGSVTFHMTRGFATLQRFGVANLQANNRVWAGLTKGTSIATGAPPFTSMIGIWQAGGNIMVGTDGGDATDSGFTFQASKEYKVTTYCAPGGTTVDVAFVCENGDTGSHTVTDVAHSTGAYALQLGVNKGTGATGAEAWFIYWGAAQPD